LGFKQGIHISPLQGGRGGTGGPRGHRFGGRGSGIIEHFFALFLLGNEKYIIIYLI